VEELSEKEQLEQMRAWWSDYGNYVLGGIVVGIGIMVGVGQYRSYTESHATEASGLYESIYEATVDGNLESAESAAAELYENYGSTIYTDQARLAMARLYMENGRDADAAAALRAVLDHAPDSEIGLVARLRLAKVLIYQNDAEGVVELLRDVEASAFAARYAEVLGDAYVLLQRYDDARDQYLLAMSDDVARPTVDRVLVQMKLDDLPSMALPEEAEPQEEGEAAPDAEALPEEQSAPTDDSVSEEGQE
jgi:predicted negative regulator of RcsB-dependent stress response